jgi:pilus assembly protein FimV
LKTLACRLVLLLALLCAAPLALALGLGQIEVKSRLGEPLLAEVPIISADPSELETLQARLASPDTFRRIGLEPPAGLVSDLHFDIALDPRGRPVVRITSDMPVQQPLLTFLVEVDWGQGRLVREYSALVDTPQTVAAPAPAPIRAPEAAPSNAIVRDPPVAAAPSATLDESADPVASEDDAGAPAPADAPAGAAVAAAPATAPAARSEYGPVQRNQTLGAIAAELAAGSGRSVNQVMLALLRANPEAFIGGNINLIRQGAVLRVPPSQEWSQASVAEANALVREHVARWRGMRQAVQQPEAVAATGGAGPAGAAGAAASQATTADARLEIVPPGGGSQAQAGTRSGATAGGEGEMLQQQELVQARETLAAKDAEIQDLQARLTELEQLREQQQQLIQMKDSELAAAQQRLAQGNAQAGTTAEPQPAEQGGSAAPWLGFGLVLVLAAGIAWWLRSRRQAARPVRRQGYGFASAPVVDEARTSPAARPVPAVDEVPVAPAAPAPVSAVPEPAPAVPVEAPEPRLDDPALSWRSAPAAATGASPTWHAAGDETPSGFGLASAGQERLELARAYIDLGDIETARGLLQEVAVGGEAEARGEAERLLRELA